MGTNSSVCCTDHSVDMINELVDISKAAAHIQRVDERTNGMDECTKGG